MNSRIAATLALAVAATGLTATAEAAKPKPPKPVCNLVTDPANDTFLVRAQDGSAAKGQPYDAAFDITSADIASDGKVVTVAIRLASIGSAQTSPQGRGYAFDFLLPSSELQASMRAVFIQGQAPHYEVTYKDPSVPNSPSVFVQKVTGVVDEKKKEVRMTAPVSAFAALGTIAKNTLITPAGDAATAGRAAPPAPTSAGAPVSPRYVFADVATVSKPYRAGTPSCVVPGK